jgi:hypothetical protein
VQQRRAEVEGLPLLARVLTQPLQDTQGLARAAAGSIVVVYAVNPIYTRWDTELLPLFEQGLAVAQALGAHFMLPASVYNYGVSMPTLLTEATPFAPTTQKGRLRVTMEQTLHRRAAEQGLRSTIVRAGDFFGAGRGSWLDQLVAQHIARGKIVYPGPLDLRHAWAYLPDLARAFVALAERGAAQGVQSLHFAGHAPNGHEFVAALQSAAGSLGLAPTSTRGWRLGSMPWSVVRAVGIVHPMWRELARMSYLWRVPHALDGRALERRAGPLPATPLVAALRASLLDLGLGRDTEAAAARQHRFAA